jgi:hypothetical protein
VDWWRGHPSGQHHTPPSGGQHIEFDVRDDDGGPVSAAALPEVTATLPQEKLGPIDGRVEQSGPAGHYTAEIAMLLRANGW